MSAPKSRPPNRRASRRRPVKASVRAVCLKGTLGLGKNIAIRVLDVSEGGACLVVRVPLEKGQEVEVCLNPAGAAREAKRKGQVAWTVCRDGEIHIGVRFDKLLTYASLGDLCKLR